MIITEDMILDAIDNVRARDEFLNLNEDIRDEIYVYLTAMGAELRRKLND